MEINQNTFKHGFLGKRNKNKEEKESQQRLNPRENDKIKKKGGNSNFRSSKTSIKGEELTMEEQQEAKNEKEKHQKEKGKRENWQLY